MLKCQSIIITEKVIFIEFPIVNKVIYCTLKTSNFLNSIVIIHYLLNADRLYTFNFISLMRTVNDFFLYAKIYLLPSKLQVYLICLCLYFCKRCHNFCSLFFFQPFSYRSIFENLEHLILTTQPHLKESSGIFIFQNWSKLYFHSPVLPFLPRKHSC